MGSFRAELLLLRKYPPYWVLLAIACGVVVVLGYVLPYLSYQGKAPAQRAPTDLPNLLPGRVIPMMLSALPFWFGMLAFIMGVLMFGGDYGWRTLKTTLMQQPGRMRIFLARFAAMSVALLFTLIAIIALALVCTVPIALAEDVAWRFPSLWDVARGLAAGWLILMVWATLGAALAVTSRGTALAVGLGILYGLVFEGLVSSYRQDLSALNDVAHVFIRTNAFSLVAPLGVTDEGGGAGTFSGPYVDAWQALIFMLGYVAVFSGASALILGRRDVT